MKPSQFIAVIALCLLAGGAGRGQDTQPPVVAITQPAGNSILLLGGTQPVEAAATDNVGVSLVDFYVDHVWQASDTVPPYQWTMTGGSFSTGAHHVVARALDAAGNVAADSVSVMILDPADYPLGATPVAGGIYFRVWAPLAQNVQLEGSFTPTPLAMTAGTGGRWGLLVPGAAVGDTYQYRITGFSSQLLEKMDPRARQVENSAGLSIVYDPNAYAWGDAAYIPPAVEKWVVYELHVGTLAGRNDGTADSPATFADALSKIPHLQELGINVVEVMPIGEFPGDRSWGYNPALPYAPETVYGGPDGFKAFVDACHQAGIAVVLDVVHNHYGPFDLDLWQFDGWYDSTAPAEWQGGIYFYNDYRADTPWGDTRPDYGRPEIRQYIIDNAKYWLAEYHVDGLRWDSTVNIRQVSGTDIPNGWLLLQNAADTVHFDRPGSVMIAEDLQNWDGLTGPTGSGGAGFDSQWHARFVHGIRGVITAAWDNDRNMDDVVAAIIPAYQGQSTHQVIYTESHDEDANGHQRIPSEIDNADPDSYWARKRSTLGAGVVFTGCGMPMLFMGQEFLMDGYWADTDGTGGTYDGRVDWAYKEAFRGIFDEYRDLVTLRRELPGLADSNINVFHENNTGKVVAWHRWDTGSGLDDLVVVGNFSNTEFTTYSLGLPYPGRWVCQFHGDSGYYNGDFQNAEGRGVVAYTPGSHGFGYSGDFHLAPYSLQVYVPEAAWQRLQPYADTTGDGTVTAADMVKLARYLAGSVPAPTGDRWMDLDENMSLGAADLAVLANYLAGNATALPWR